MDSLQSKCTPEQNQFIEELFKSEYTNLFCFAYNTLLDENLSDVAVQDTFLIALNKPDALCSSQKPVGWLYNTIKNVIKHIIRDRDYLYRKNISLYEAAKIPASYTDTYSEVSLETQRSDEWALQIEIKAGKSEIERKIKIIQKMLALFPFLMECIYEGRIDEWPRNRITARLTISTN